MANTKNQDLVEGALKLKEKLETMDIQQFKGKKGDVEKLSRRIRTLLNLLQKCFPQ
jgi:hypothetical protein